MITYNIISNYQAHMSCLHHRSTQSRAATAWLSKQQGKEKVGTLAYLSIVFIQICHVQFPFEYKKNRCPWLNFSAQSPLFLVPLSLSPGSTVFTLSPPDFHYPPSYPWLRPSPRVDSRNETFPGSIYDLRISNLYFRSLFHGCHHRNSKQILI